MKYIPVVVFMVLSLLAISCQKENFKEDEIVDDTPTDTTVTLQNCKLIRYERGDAFTTYHYEGHQLVNTVDSFYSIDGLIIRDEIHTYNSSGLLSHIEFGPSTYNFCESEYYYTGDRLDSIVFCSTPFSRITYEYTNSKLTRINHSDNDDGLRYYQLIEQDNAGNFAKIQRYNKDATSGQFKLYDTRLQTFDNYPQPAPYLPAQDAYSHFHKNNYATIEITRYNNAGQVSWTSSYSYAYKYNSAGLPTEATIDNSGQRYHYHYFYECD